MSRKEIQKERIKNYFIEAGIEIINNEHYKFTARNIGELAGFSYATIYNYFENLKELKAHCIFKVLEKFCEELMYIKENSMEFQEKIILFSKEYFNFFIREEKWFKLAFIEDLEEYLKNIYEKKNQNTLDFFLEDLILSYFLENKLEIDLKRIRIIKELLLASIHSKLLFSIYKRDIKERKEIVMNIESEINIVLSQL